MFPFRIATWKINLSSIASVNNLEQENNFKQLEYDRRGINIDGKFLKYIRFAD